MREINYSFRKDIGARAEQQDSISIGKRNNNILVSLGDGMGGHTGGAMASKLFIGKAETLFQNESQGNIQAFFQKIIEETEKEISNLAKEHRLDPHTTATLALINDQGVTFANIGDSRVYIFDRTGLLLRSRDHSVPEMLLQMGEITEDEMATHPDQNKLTKSVGPNSHEKLSHYSFRFEANKDYMVLVCSDGFWEYVKEKEMVHFLFHNEIETALSNMVEIARERGGDRGDNISVAAVTLIASTPPTLDESEPITAIRETMIEEPYLKEAPPHSNRTVALLLLLAMAIGMAGLYFYLKPTKENVVTLKKNTQYESNRSNETNKSQQEETTK